MVTERKAASCLFLAAHGWGQARRAPLADDASFRRYERLFLEDRTVVLMDAPPPQEDVRPFINIGCHLSRLGYSTPEIYGHDDVHGFILLEDLGDDTFTRILAAGGPETTLYENAVDVLIDLHNRPADETVLPELPAYDDRQLLSEANLLPEWAYPSLSTDARKSFEAAWLDLFPLVHRQARTLVLRDYHVDNLIWLPHRDGIAACGLLDFQDALAGPGAYDLVSLLEDARRDIAGELKASLLERYLTAFPGMDKAAFMSACHILAAQRHTKIIGIFTRLSVRDGKAEYLAHIPRVWRFLQEVLENPVLDSLKEWFDTYIPEETRAIK